MQTSSLYFDYAYVLVFSVSAALFVIVNVSVLGRLVRPFLKDPQKETTYECGEPAVGSSWVRFDMRFYTVALLFLIFDVEVAFLYPWALVFRELKAAGLFVFVEMAIFLGILLVGFVYVWARGDLDWIKSTAAQGDVQAARAAGRAEERREGEGAAGTTLASQGECRRYEGGGGSSPPPIKEKVS